MIVANLIIAAVFAVLAVAITITLGGSVLVCLTVYSLTGATVFLALSSLLLRSETGAVA